jgi:hypothetical protein
MNRLVVLSLLALTVSGCASLMVEKDANDSCAKQGKKAFIFDGKQSGIPLVFESASVMVLCVGPDDVTRMPETFGADAVSASNFHGAGIVAVTAEAVAGKAGLKPNDIVYEFAGHPIASAADLRLEVDSIAPGDQVLIKLRRSGTKETAVTARF